MIRARWALVVGTFGLVGVVACSGDDAEETTPVDTTIPDTPTETTASAGTDGRVVVEELFESPARYEAVAREYCEAWPEIDRVIRSDASFARVPTDGFEMPNLGRGQSPPDGVAQGAGSVVAVAAALDYEAVDCSDAALVYADWVALPVSAVRTDGFADQGFWILRIVDDQIHWHLIYGNEAESDGSAAVEPNPALVSEAREFCSIIEGTGFTRDADEFLAAMTSDPAVHNNPEGFYWTGAEAVAGMIDLYPSTDDIWCGDDIATNGEWSVEAVRIDNPPFDLTNVGIMVHRHIDGKIHRQFAHFTRASGTANWGLPLED